MELCLRYQTPRQKNRGDHLRSCSMKLHQTAQIAMLGDSLKCDKDGPRVLGMLGLIGIGRAGGRCGISFICPACHCSRLNHDMGLPLRPGNEAESICRQCLAQAGLLGLQS